MAGFTHDHVPPASARIASLRDLGDLWLKLRGLSLCPICYQMAPTPCYPLSHYDFPWVGYYIGVVRYGTKAYRIIPSIDCDYSLIKKHPPHAD